MYGIALTERFACKDRGIALRKPTNEKHTDGVVVFSCKQYGECTLVRKLDELPTCAACLTRNSDYKEPPVRSVQLKTVPDCDYRSAESVKNVACACPSGNRTIPAYSCTKHGLCTVSTTFIPSDKSVKVCALCTDYSKAESKSPKKWAYGVTTVPSRKSNLLVKTITSLAKAGWDNPRLFVDGGSVDDWKGCKLPLTIREKTNALSNWWLGMHELYARNPLADYFMMVQDDVLFVSNLREYIEATPWPGRGYLNLYTFPDNLVIAQGKKGFFRASTKKMGLGALALVFDKESIVKILASEHMVEKFRPIDVVTGKEKKQPQRAVKAIDGGVAWAMSVAGMSEWCHNPSLVQHIGEVSTLGHSNPTAASFPGEGFDARSLL